MHYIQVHPRYKRADVDVARLFVDIYIPKRNMLSGMYYLLSGYHVAFELLIAFVPSVLAFACSFTTGSDGQRQSHFFNGS